MKNPDPSQKADLLFCLLDDLSLEGYEASLKLLFQSFLGVRFLIGVKTKNMSKTRFEYICKRLEMPDTYYAQCLEKLTESNMILFGFEEDGKRCIYKIYLEFNEKNRLIVRQTGSKTPLIQYLGYKWDSFDNQKSLITTYKWFPFISTSEMYERIEQIYAKKDQMQLLLIEDLIQLGISNIKDSLDPYIYLEATDSLRKSFDLNLYKANLTMGQLEQIVLKSMHFFEIDTRKFNVFLWKLRNKVFGHISGGYSSFGDIFLSLYYDVFSDSKKRKGL